MLEIQIRIRSLTDKRYDFVPIVIVLHKTAVVSSTLRWEHVPNVAQIFNIKTVSNQLLYTELSVCFHSVCCVIISIKSIGYCLFDYWISAQILCHAKLN